jgi:hypothetical protein
MHAGVRQYVRITRLVAERHEWQTEEFNAQRLIVNDFFATGNRIPEVDVHKIPPQDYKSNSLILFGKIPRSCEK